MRLVAAKPALRVVRIDRPLVERVVAPGRVALPVARGQRLGEVQVLDRGERRRPLAARRAPARSTRPGRLGARRLLREAARVHHLGGLLP